MDLVTPVKSLLEETKKDQPQSKSPLMSMFTSATMVAGNLMGTSEVVTKKAPTARSERVEPASDVEIEVMTVLMPTSLTEAKSMPTLSTGEGIQVKKNLVQNIEAVSKENPDVASREELIRQAFT